MTNWQYNIRSVNLLGGVYRKINGLKIVSN